MSTRPKNQTSTNDREKIVVYLRYAMEDVSKICPEGARHLQAAIDELELQDVSADLAQTKRALN